MALCTRCGQQAEAKAEFCASCRDRTSGAYSPERHSAPGSYAAARYVPEGGYATSYDAPSELDRGGTDAFKLADPDRSGPHAFRFSDLDPGGTDAFMSSGPAASPQPSRYPGAGSGQDLPGQPSPPDMDRQFRYEQSVADESELPQFDHEYLADQAAPPASPTGRLADFGITRAPVAGRRRDALGPTGSRRTRQ